MSLKKYLIDMSALNSNEKEELISLLDARSFITRPVSIPDDLYESYWDELDDLSKFPILSRCTVQEIL